MQQNKNGSSYLNCVPKTDNNVVIVN